MGRLSGLIVNEKQPLKLLEGLIVLAFFAIALIVVLWPMIRHVAPKNLSLKLERHVVMFAMLANDN